MPERWSGSRRSCARSVMRRKKFRSRRLVGSAETTAWRCSRRLRDGCGWRRSGMRRRTRRLPRTSSTWVMRRMPIWISWQRADASACSRRPRRCRRVRLWRWRWREGCGPCCLLTARAAGNCWRAREVFRARRCRYRFIRSHRRKGDGCSGSWRAVRRCVYGWKRSRAVARWPRRICDSSCRVASFRGSWSVRISTAGISGRARWTTASGLRSSTLWRWPCAVRPFITRLS